MIFRDLLRSERPLCDLGAARTLDPLIKSQLLDQLSYEVVGNGLFLNCGAKLGTFYGLCKFFGNFFIKNFQLSRVHSIISLLLNDLLTSINR